MTEVMREAEKILDKKHLIGKRRGHSSFRGRCRSYNNPKTSYRRQGNFRDRGHSRQERFRSQTGSPARGYTVALRSPSRDKDICFSFRQSGLYYISPYWYLYLGEVKNEFGVAWII